MGGRWDEKFIRWYVMALWLRSTMADLDRQWSERDEGYARIGNQIRII